MQPQTIRTIKRSLAKLNAQQQAYLLTDAALLLQRLYAGDDELETWGHVRDWLKVYYRTTDGRRK